MMILICTALLTCGHMAFLAGPISQDISQNLSIVVNVTVYKTTEAKHIQH